MKLLIIGIVASGKTTLAKRLSKKNCIPSFELDLIVHDDVNKIKRTNEEQKRIIDIIDKINSSWIIEGTLRENMDYLLDMASNIIYIDIPLKVRKRRIVIRYLKQKIGIEESNYKPTLSMLKMMFKWTNTYEKNKESFTKRLAKYKDKIVILDSVEKFNEFNL